MANPTEGLIITPDPANLRHVDVLLRGPKETPFEKGVFRLELFLPEDYPKSAPHARFLTKVFHPNINDKGGICLDVLQQQWSPVLGIRTSVQSIQSLLAFPYLGHYLALNIGKQWEKDEKKAKQIAKQWTEKYAMEKEDIEAMEKLREEIEAKEKEKKEKELRKKKLFVDANKAEASTSIEILSEELKTKVKTRNDDETQDAKKKVLIDANKGKASTSKEAVVTTSEDESGDSMMKLLLDAFKGKKSTSKKKS